MTSQWPEWVCKNACGAGPFPPNTKHVKCPGPQGRGGRPGPGCGAPLVRWMAYQEKRPGKVYPKPAPAVKT